MRKSQDGPVLRTLFIAMALDSIPGQVLRSHNIHSMAKEKQYQPRKSLLHLEPNEQTKQGAAREYQSHRPIFFFESQLTF